MQRSEDLRVLFSAVRSWSDSHRDRNGMPSPLAGILTWLKTLDSSTLRNYVLSMDKPAKRDFWGGPWGDVIGLLIESYEKKFDDSITALALFASNAITPMVGGSQAVLRSDGFLPIFEESMEYVNSLFDTIHYHADYVPDATAFHLLEGNVYTMPNESREALFALIKVTDAIMSSELKDFLVDDHTFRNDEGLPHSSFTVSGSLRIRNGELVQYIFAHPEQSSHIASVITERKTDDVSTIRTVLEQDVLAVSSGVL